MTDSALSAPRTASADLGVSTALRSARVQGKDEEMKMWNRSMSEEALAVGYFIAGALVWSTGIHWLAIALFVKAGFDTVCAVTTAIIEIMREKLKAESKSG